MSLLSSLRLENKKLFPKFLNCLKTFQNEDPKVMFDKIQYKSWEEHERSFVGHLLCGESCFILKYLLEKKGFDNIQVFKNSRRTEYGIDDHVFLHIDNIIIDPTYRQFFYDYRSNDINCLFRKTIFNQMSPTLINYVDDVDLVLKNLVNVNKYCYGKPFEEYEELKKYWLFQEEITPRYNLNKVMNERYRLKGLPQEYSRLVNYLDSLE